jgi:cyclic nucleotide gated channel, plant
VLVLARGAAGHQVPQGAVRAGRVRALACPEPLHYGAGAAADRHAWAGNVTARGTCLDSGDNYQYGAYKWTVMLVANPNRLEKVLLPIFWGLMTLR